MPCLARRATPIIRNSCPRRKNTRRQRRRKYLVPRIFKDADFLFDGKGGGEGRELENRKSEKKKKKREAACVCVCVREKRSLYRQLAPASRERKDERLEERRKAFYTLVAACSRKKNLSIRRLIFCAPSSSSRFCFLSFIFLCCGRCDVLFFF